MKQPDDIEIKAEIDAIARRIDRIMETVQKYFPVSESSSGPDEPPTAEITTQKSNNDN